MSESHFLLPLPGVGVLAFTADEFTGARRRGAELLGSYASASAGFAPDGEAPMRSRVLLDAEGMASATGVPSSWYESAARRGEIPTVHFGRWVRFDLDEVLAHARKVGLKRVVGVEHKVAAPAKLPAHRQKAQR